MKISEELLKEVQGIQNISDIEIKGNMVLYYKHNERYSGDSCYYKSRESINIYELAFDKCVEWAKSENCELDIKFDAGGTFADISKDEYSICSKRSREDISAVFEVYQYYLDSKER